MHHYWNLKAIFYSILIIILGVFYAVDKLVQTETKKNSNNIKAAIQSISTTKGIF